MPEATMGKENIVPSSPKGHHENGSYPDSPMTNGSSKDVKRTKGKMGMAKIHLLDGTVSNCHIDVSTFLLSAGLDNYINYKMRYCTIKSNA